MKPQARSTQSSFSAYAVLKLLGRGVTQAFEAGDLFRRSRDERVGTSPLAYNASIAMGRSNLCGTFGWSLAFRPAQRLTDVARVIHSSCRQPGQTTAGH